MNSRFTLIVVLAAVVIGALALYAYRSNVTPVDLAKGPATPTPGPILTLAEADVQELAVSGPAGKQYVLKRVAGGWEVDGVRASEQVSSTVANVVKLTAAQQLGADRKPEDYGFSTPTLTVTLKTAAGAATTFTVGDDVVGESSYAYLRLDGEGKPILVVSNFDLKTLVDWLDNKPLAPTPTPALPDVAPVEGSPPVAGTPAVEPVTGDGATAPGPPEATPEPAMATSTPST